MLGTASFYEFPSASTSEYHAADCRQNQPRPNRYQVRRIRISVAVHIEPIVDADNGYKHPCDHRQ